MKLENFPDDLKDNLIPQPSGDLKYNCLKCGAKHGPEQLYYTCPGCGGLLLLEDEAEERLAQKPGAFWQRLFDHRRMLNVPALSGIFTFHEFLAPLIPLEDVIYLGEGHTPIIAAPADLAQEAGCNFYFKHDGQNPSASFKDRGMAAALSYLKYLIRHQNLKDVLAICASTGDTSAAAALYAGALGQAVKSAVLLPKGKVTIPQLGQPLGAGAKVFELPGVFDDCMKVVEYLSEHYQVALLNSKNPWRVLGQESYAYEVAMGFDYDLNDKVIFVPVGNAGNITAIMSGFLKFFRYGVINKLPKIVAVQSEKADPVFRYYSQPEGKRQYAAVSVKPSVAQAAMIGDPVSFPRVLKKVEDYEKAAGAPRFFAVQVKEQDIMDNMLKANRRGFTICTQGGESLAGLKEAVKQGFISQGETAVLDSTAHALKFAEFQNAYFENNLSDFEVTAKAELINRPLAIEPQGLDLPAAGKVQSALDREKYVAAAASAVAQQLGLKSK